MISKFLKKGQKGFTIIEVMIVLAIAGLILVVVLVAVPQLQRNQRNSARTSILARISTEIANYSGNNNGNIPLTQTDLDSVTSRYLASVNIKDPSSGVNMPLVRPGSAPATGTVPGSTQGTANYYNGYVCDGERVTTTGATARNYALWTQLEGTAVNCISNN